MSGHIGRTEICSSCAKPVHVDVCNFPIDYSYSETVWCVGGTPLVRVSQWQGATQIISWVTTAGATVSPSVAAVSAATFGACPVAANDFEVIERFVCSAGTTIVRRETFNNGVSTAVAWFGLNGAAVAAPATFTEGACEGQTLDLEVEYVCAAGVTLVRRRIINTTTGALVAETFIGSNGATVAAPAAYTIGSCQPSDSEVTNDLACSGGVQVLRQQTWTNGILTATNWFSANGAIIAAPAAFTWGACTPGNDTEVIERFVCSAGVTLVQRTLFTNGVAAAPTYFGLNGAVVAAPAAFTEGPCDDQDIDLEVEYVCAANVTLIRRRIVDGETGALISETFIGTNGATVATPAAYTLGQCVAPARDVELDYVCAAGVTLSRVRLFDTSTNPPTILSTQFFGVNGTTVAAPATFTQGACASLAGDNEFIPLCDVGTNPPTPYIRRAVVDATTGVVTFTNINVTTGAAYAPVTPGTCDGYSLVSDDACLVTNATGVITSVRVTQLYRYGQIVGAPVIVNLQTNAVVAVAAGQTLANCDALDLATEVFCRTDTGATLIRKVMSLGSVELWSEWIDAVTLATVAAPPAAQLTQDCDIATDFEVVCASIGGVQVSVEVRRTFRDGVLLSTVYTRLDTNAVIAAPTIVPCSPETGARTVLRCGATSNATTTASVQATRVALENDVIFTKACPTTAGLTNNTVSYGVNAAVNSSGAIPANARSVTLYNVTRARINLFIPSHGNIQVPPNGTYSFNLPDNVPPFSGAWSIINQAGNAGPAVFGINPHTILDWGTRV